MNQNSNLTHKLSPFRQHWGTITSVASCTEACHLQLQKVTVLTGDATSDSVKKPSPLTLDEVHFPWKGMPLALP